MDILKLEEKAAHYLHTLCREIPNRRLGAKGNRQAVEFVAEGVANFGFEILESSFECLDWEDNGAECVVSDQGFEVFSSPYSLGCEVAGPLKAASTVGELGSLALENCVLLLHGEITKEQLMPKGFPFYNPEHHQRIYQALEQKNPLAIITATSRNPELAGGMYPFPMIEDGDFNIPSVYMRDTEGNQMAGLVGETASLSINSRRIPARGRNIVAQKQPDAERKIVLCAHIDSKDNSPGALDNGTGIVLLLVLAELLANYDGHLGLEILALNGEDHYSAQGHKKYLQDNAGRFEEILLAVNTDLLGYKEGHTAYSLYACPGQVEAAIRAVMDNCAGVLEGEPWYQGDHSVFIQQGCPAAAITSDQFMRLSTDVTHTPKDDLHLVDYSKVVKAALALKDVIEALNAIA